VLLDQRVRTNKRFKEVQIIVVAKALHEHYGADVSSQQVYNHLWKWRVKWLTISWLET
jgi:hypothetical protein